MSRMEPLDPALVKTIADPLRAAIVAKLGTGQKGPVEVAREFEESGQFASNNFGNLLALVSYAFKVLKEKGLIELNDTKAVRGALAHYYALTPACNAALRDLAIRINAFGGAS